MLRMRSPRLCLISAGLRVMVSFVAGRILLGCRRLLRLVWMILSLRRGWYSGVGESLICLEFR